MTFSEALEAMKAGEHLRRKHWEGTYTFIGMNIGCTEFFYDPDGSGERCVDLCEGLCDADLLAEDWEIVE